MKQMGITFTTAGQLGHVPGFESMPDSGWRIVQRWGQCFAVKDAGDYWELMPEKRYVLRDGRRRCTLDTINTIFVPKDRT